MDTASIHRPPLAASGTPAIVDFPPELIDYIHGFTGPENHLNFALTCKRIADSSQDILRRHQQAFALYGVSSDLSPTTVPTLLRKVVNDPIVAWNVHTFESWGSRSRWESWKPFLSVYRREQGIADDDATMADIESGLNGYVGTDEGDADIENDEGQTGSEESGNESDGVRSRESDSDERDFDTSKCSWNKRIGRYFRRGELEDLMEYLREDIGISDSRAARAWEEIQNGSDGILKVLLFCLCPRLKTLRYASSGQAESNDARLNWLLKVTIICYKNNSWPQGLQALRDVAIGIDSGFGADMRQPPNLIIGLLHLPSVKSLYIAGSDRRWNEQRGTRDGWEGRGMDVGFSSVEHLFFDNCNLTAHAFFKDSILRAPKKLVTFAFRGGQLFGAEENIVQAAKKQGKSLETVILYHPSLLNRVCTLDFHPEGSDGFRNLKCFNLFMGHILRQGMLDLGFESFHQKGDTESQRTIKRESFVKWFQDKPPSSTEVIVLALSDGVYREPLDDAEVDLVDDAIVGLLESGKHKKLKAIYFGPLVPYDKDSTMGQKTVAAGRKFGVDVYAPCNNRPPMHAIAFPKPPEKYDLATGPWASQPRAGQVWDAARRYVDDKREGTRIFDPCNGRWIII